MRNKYVIQKINFSDPQIEKDIQEYALKMRSVIEVYAPDDGAKGFPKTATQWKTRAFNYIEAMAKTMVDTVQQKLLPVTAIEAKKDVEANARQKTQKLTAYISELTIKSKICREELKSLRVNWMKIAAFWTVMVLVFVFGAFDGSMTYDSILGAGMGLRPALMYGIAIACVIGAGSHFGAGWVMKTQSRKARIARVAIQVLVVGALFYWLGDMRAGYINSDVDINPSAVPVQNGTGVSGLSIGGISLVIFMASLCFSMCVHRTRFEKEQYRLYTRKRRELHKIETEKRKAQSGIAFIETEERAEIFRINQACEYALSLKKHIIDIARECLCLYANINLNNRTDGLCPDFFSNPPQFNI